MDGSSQPPYSSENDLHAVLNAQETRLADYLNQPVHNILARLGIDGAKNLPASQDPQAGTGAADPSAASPNAFDPSAMIQPVTDALGTLGSGDFGDTDPTKALDSVSQTLDSAGQAAQQALAAVQGLWQGDAATSAAAKTTDAVADGATVSEQATNLSESLATAAADVQQAQTRLIEIITEFWATIEAIGPNIIFPWGIAAAIAAANKAITSASEVISELQASLGAETGKVTAVGAPAELTSVPTLSTPDLGQIMQVATGLMSPVMQAVSSATSAAQQNTPHTPGDKTDKPDEQKATDEQHPGGAPAAAGGAGGFAPKVPGVGVLAAARTAPPQISMSETSATPRSLAVGASPAAGSSGSMMGGAPMGHGARPGSDSGYSAASFLHTSDQGDQIVGDLGEVAPPVLGEAETHGSNDIELRI